MNITNRQSELREVIVESVREEFANRRTRDIVPYCCETDNGIMAEIGSNNQSYSAMLEEMTAAARGLTRESDSVSIIYAQSHSSKEDRVAKLDISNEDFESMNDVEQRLHVAHGLRLQ